MRSAPGGNGPLATRNVAHAGTAAPRNTTEAEIYLDQADAERCRGANAERYNVVTVPVIRALGLNAILAAAVVHEALAGNALLPLWPLALLIEAYAAGSWLVLRGWWARLRERIDLQTPLVYADIAVCTVATHATGGEQSWLFFLLVIRLADQTFVGFRRVLALAHVAPAAYLAMLVYIAAVDGRALDPAHAVLKTVLLYGTGLYLALVGRTAESLRSGAREAVRVGRELISELSEKSARLELSIAEAEEATRAKNRFLAHMSHELRTPLTAIISQSEALMDEADPKKDARLVSDLAQIAGEARKLAGMVGDVLDASNIDAGTVALAPEWFDVVTLVKDVAATAHPTMARGENLFSIYLDADLGMMRTDRSRVRQVLAHLLSNAAKFTAQGKVTLTVRREAEIARAWIVFEIRDTGIGISPEVEARLFRLFTQGDGSTTRRYEGAGLGLVIARHVTEMLGGTLTYETAENAGTCFTVRIPTDAPARDADGVVPRTTPWPLPPLRTTQLS